MRSSFGCGFGLVFSDPSGTMGLTTPDCSLRVLYTTDGRGKTRCAMYITQAGLISTRTQ